MKAHLTDWVASGAAALVLSAAARSLPEPGDNKFYQWFYTFTHTLLANFDKLHPPTK